MNDDDILKMINNVKGMVDSGNIPENIKDVLNNIDNSKKMPNGSNTGTHSNSTSNNLNIDMDTVLKIKNVLDSINHTDDPRANLLHSLKPYLRDTRKDKVDQYVNLLNISKIAEVMNNEKKENNGNV